MMVPVPINNLLEIAKLHSNEHMSRVFSKSKKKRRIRKKKTQTLLDSLIEQLMIFYTKNNRSSVQLKKIEIKKAMANKSNIEEDIRILESLELVLEGYDSAFDKNYSDKGFDKFEEFYTYEVVPLIRSIIRHPLYSGEDGINEVRLIFKTVGE